MGKEYVLTFVSVPVFLKYSRYLISDKIVVEAFRVPYVFVVGNASIFGYLLVYSRIDKVCLITVSYVSTVHKILEV